MSRDDRDLPGELDEDQPVTPAEQARAEAFGNWLDALSAGDPLPPAMDSEDRALLETATMVLASSGAVDLDPDRARRLVDEALENAVLDQRPLVAGPSGGDAVGQVGAGGRPLRFRGAAVPLRAGSAAEPAGRHHRDERDAAGRSSTDLVLSGRRRTDVVLRHLPWAVASLAAAAAIFLFMARPNRTAGSGQFAPPPVVLRLRTANTSRPADPLIGAIPRRDAARASERLDILFADRMDGYRDLRLRRALGEEHP